jgi:hypothetical protein
MANKIKMTDTLMVILIWAGMFLLGSFAMKTLIKRLDRPKRRRYQ